MVGVQKACLQGASWHRRGRPAAFHKSIPLFPWKCLTKLRDTDLSQQTLVLHGLICLVAGFGAHHSRRAITLLAQRDDGFQRQLVAAEERVFQPQLLCELAQFQVGGAVKHALFLPAGLRLPAAKTLELAQRAWKLQLPNVLIACDAGTVHPKAFAGLELCGLDQFQQLWGEATQQAARNATPPYLTVLHLLTLPCYTSLPYRATGCTPQHAATPPSTPRSTTHP